MSEKIKMAIAGLVAGAVNGLFGAGGGMVLVPLLTMTGIPEEDTFPSSVSIILPICLVSLSFTAFSTGIPLPDAFPYLLGSLAGGIAAGVTGNKIPVKWLHRILGIFILWGGYQYLC